MAAANVLTRKLSGGGVARSPLPDTEAIGECFARLIENRLRPLVKTMIGAMVLECRVVKLSEALQSVSVPAMLGVIAVEDADTDGLISIDTDLSYHLIDLMLGGDPAAPVPTTRTFTGIDMALCRLHLEALVAAFSDAIATCLGRPVTKAITIREQRQNISQMRLAPDYIDVLVFSIALDVGDAARTGCLYLLLPLSALDVIRAAIEANVVETPDRPADLWKAQMRQAAAVAPVVVDAVLHRQKMTVGALERLRPGDFIEIPPNAPESVQLTLRQRGGKTTMLATGRLGAYQGTKVVKMDDAIDKRVRDYVKRVL